MFEDLLILGSKRYTIKLLSNFCMKQGQQGKKYTKSPRTLLTLFALLLPFPGITFSLMQARQQQTSHSSASGITVTPTLLPQNCDVGADQLAINPKEQTLFDEINAHRQLHGVPPLVWSPALKQAAAW